MLFHCNVTFAMGAFSQANHKGLPQRHKAYVLKWHLSNVFEKPSKLYLH